MVDMTPTNNFIKTLTQTPTDAAQLSANFARLKRTNDELIKLLGYPEEIAQDLDRLNTALSLANSVLSIVSVIPEVGEAAEGFKVSVTEMMEAIKEPKAAADRIAAKAKPLRAQLQKLDPILVKGIAAANEINASSNAFLKHFVQINNCIENLPDGKPKEASQNYLNQFSTKATPEVADLNKAMEGMNSAIDALYNEMNAIIQALNPLESIMQGIEEVFSVLNPVLSILKELKHDLTSIKIEIPIPYPHMVSLYDIFHTLGEFANLAMKPIQELVDKLLSALHIKLPEIPGLSDLLHININLPSIPDFSSLIAQISGLISQLEALFKLFTLSCSPGENQKDFNTQLNG